MEVDDPGPGEVDPGPENIQEDMETEEPVSNKEVLGKTQIDSIAEHKFQFLSYKAAPDLNMTHALFSKYRETRDCIPAELRERPV